MLAFAGLTGVLLAACLLVLIKSRSDVPNVQTLQTCEVPGRVNLIACLLYYHFSRMKKSFLLRCFE